MNSREDDGVISNVETKKSEMFRDFIVRYVFVLFCSRSDVLRTRRSFSSLHLNEDSLDSKKKDA